MKAQAAKHTTILSTKGQVILPKPVRDARRWRVGTRLLVEETSEGVLLKPAPAVAVTEPAQVFGLLKYDGAAKSVQDMDAAIAAEARRREVGVRKNRHAVKPHAID